MTFSSKKVNAGSDKMNLVKRKMNFERMLYNDEFKHKTLDQISKQTKLAKGTISQKLSTLRAESLLDEQYAWIQTPKAKLTRLEYALSQIVKCGIIDNIIKQTNPTAIVLFGSFAKGEWEKTSDIDIFIETTKKKIDLSTYEKKLKHPIQVFMNVNIQALPKELQSNIINGVKLYGYLNLQ